MKDIGDRPRREIHLHDVVYEVNAPRRKEWVVTDLTDGMRTPVERMKRLARRLEPRALFSAPEVVSVVDEDGVELTSVVVDVFIPEESDGMPQSESSSTRGA